MGISITKTKHTISIIGCFQSNATIKPETGKLVAVIPKLKTFEVSLSLSNLRVIGNRLMWMNIFHVTKPGTSDGQPGHRLVSINFGTRICVTGQVRHRCGLFYFRTDTNMKRHQAHLETQIMDKTTDGKYDLYNGTFQFRFVQEQNENGEFVLTLSMNGTFLKNGDNFFVQKIPDSDLRIVENAELYISDKNRQAMDVEIDAFKLKTG